MTLNMLTNSVSQTQRAVAQPLSLSALAAAQDWGAMLGQVLKGKEPLFCMCELPPLCFISSYAGTQAIHR